ncbi:MAG TPA: DUF4186 family protein [Hyphomicrobiaceae bacterium]|nr:DUF4186 family protein [Hyphomicrobiaceae bacterium]
MPARDIDGLFAELGRSPFRRRFRLGRRERVYLEAKGLDAVMAHARHFIAVRLAPARPVNDGKQTPFRGHPVFVAQHATATCCRRCLERWHAIARGHPLERSEQEHVLAVLERWLREQSGRRDGA